LAIRSTAYLSMYASYSVYNEVIASDGYDALANTPSYQRIVLGIYKAKLQSVGVSLHPPLIVRLTYGTFRGSLSPT
jgi:hypothetical protein